MFPGMLDAMSRRDSVLAALVVAIWGVNFVVISWGLDGMPPLTFAALRFALVLVPAVFVVPRPTGPFRLVAAVGAFMSLGQFGLLYSSIHAGMPSGLAALVLQSQVIFTITISSVRLRERPSSAQVAGVALGVVGLVIVGFGRGGHVPLGALLLCLGAGLSWAIGNVISRASGIAGGLSLTVWSAVIVPVPLLTLSLVLDGPHAVGSALADISARSVLSTLFTGILASLLGYAIYTTLLSRYPAAQVAPWTLGVPAIAMVAAWVFLDERPNGAEALGGVLLLAGVLVSMLPVGQRAATPRWRSVERASSRIG